MSLAGAQDKLPVAVIDGQISVPVNGAPSTHILKPDNSRLPGSVQNEALCMVLARRMGLDVAPVTTGVAGERSYLLVGRYDRSGSGEAVRRLHQEDFCQALGRPPAAKYEFNGTGTPGPSIGDMFGLVRKYMTARDITRLLDAVILNIAIGNVDSHAKNYSILLGPNGAQLAPLYDLMSGLAWAGITQNHAQAIGGQRRGRHIYGRHWRRMAKAAGEDLHDGATWERFLDAVDHHPRARILYDPSHMLLQQLDYLAFIDRYHDRIACVHIKDAEFRPDGRTGVYGGYQAWPDRAGRFRSLGDGQIDFKQLFTKLAHYDFDGWAVLEWECAFKHPEDGAREGAQFIREHIIRVCPTAFDDFASVDADRDRIRGMMGLKP